MHESTHINLPLSGEVPRRGGGGTEAAFSTVSLNSAYCGSVKVKVLDENGNLRFESDELFGNYISARVRFAGLENTVGRIVLELSDAHIYAIGSSME